ncbi:MAG: hypothetical protein CSB13_03595 [Chloroflexi bacterium]|nr:MAG: hypothetical protein CSB13_03595 [Chloroflexota bacterium]
MLDTTVWNSRWQACAATLDEMQQAYTTLNSPTFEAMSICLKAFGGDQFDFFITGFESHRLLPSPNFPPENILRATLDQVSYDITAIRQAVDQLQDGFPTMKESLAIASALTQNALNLGIESQLIKQAAVIACFIKAANIRVIPYAPVALVRVPYTCFTTKRDYLATPHEIGHYIYHNGAIASDLHNLLPAMPDWGAGWLEEIFADVYGCLVAGPVIGLDFEDLLTDNDLGHFLTSDGEHPVDVVRPYIYIKTLNKMGFLNAAEALKNRWHHILVRRGNPHSFYPDDNYGEIPLALAKDFVEQTAVVILEYLKNRGVPTNKTWTQDLPTPETPIDELYLAFDTKLDELAETPLNNLEVDRDENKLFVTIPSGEKRNQRQIGETQSWVDWAKVQSRQHPKDPLPIPTWIGIFNAGGWPVKGPEDGGAGG